MTPEQLKQEILDGVDNMGYTTHTPVGGMSNMRWYTAFQIKNYLSTALDRMAEAVREEERERVRDWAETPLNTTDGVCAKTIACTEYEPSADDLLYFLSPNKK